jgi:hypothetical protein
MCAWTKRVKDGGHWVSIEEFLDRHHHIVVSHGVADDVKAGLIAHHGVADLLEPPKAWGSLPPAHGAGGPATTSG